MIGYACAVIDIFTIYLFMSCFFQRRIVTNKIFDGLLIFGTAILATTGNNYIQDMNLNMLIAITTIVIMLCFFEGLIKRKIFIGSIFFVFGLLLDAAIAFLFHFVLKVEIVSFVQGTDIGYMGAILFQIIRLVIVLAVFHSKQYKNDVGKSAIYGKLWIVPMLSIVLFTIVLEDQVTRKHANLPLAYSVILLLFIMNLLLYILFHRQEKLHIEREALKEQIKEQEYQMLYYQQVEAHQEEIRRLRHDMKNQLAGIYGYLNSGKVDNAKQCVSNFFKQIEVTEQKIFTANPVLNTILNIKLNNMQKQRIGHQFEITVPEELDITGNDLSILLGNLLDNAMEACEKIESNKKEIKLLIRYYNRSMIIQCGNSCDKRVTGFDTDKEDSENHGFGMVSIQKIIEKYNGEIECFSEEKWFSIQINLWNV